MTITIRPYHPDDGDALADLHRRCILATRDNFYSQAERESWAFGIKKEFYAPQGSDINEIGVAPDGRIIAFCHSTSDEVRGIYVDPDVQGAGLGFFLMQRAEARMRALDTAIAKVHAALPAVEFYQKCGYRLLARGSHKTRGGLLLATAELEKSIAF